MSETVRLLDVFGRPLRLGPEMDAVARGLVEEFGAAVIRFTSGRRSRYQQAQAMAHNIVLAGRSWVRRTYRPSPVRDAVEDWLREHPEAKTLDEITSGIALVLEAFTDDDLRQLSRHMSGEAVDIDPIEGPMGERVHARLMELPGVKFLDREGGLVRWHLQRVGG